MTTSERIRQVARNAGAATGNATPEALHQLADEVAELERKAERVMPDDWMPYRLVHERTEDEVIVMPEGWFLWRIGDPEKSTRLGDFRLPFQEAIALAEAPKEVTA